MLLMTTTSGSIRAGGWNVPVRCIAIIARTDGSRCPWCWSAQLDDGETHQRRNEMAADRRPRLRRRGVGRAQHHHDRRRERNGRERKRVAAENISMLPIATAPPMALVRMASNRIQSNMPRRVSDGKRRATGILQDTASAAPVPLSADAGKPAVLGAVL
jgi:hypothetical protein